MCEKQNASTTRLQALQLEIRDLEAELMELKREEQSVAIQREINSIHFQLEQHFDAWQDARAQMGYSTGEAHPSLESSASCYEFTTIPENSDFTVALNLIVPTVATTPASIREVYDILLDEGHPQPRTEIASDLNAEFLTAIMCHTAYRPEDMNTLQHELVKAVSNRLVTQAIQGVTR